MFFAPVFNRSPFRFLITPNAALIAPHVYFPLWDTRIPAAFWNLVKSDGSDIRVYAQDGFTQLPCEVVGINTTTKTGQLFISPGSGPATAVYVYFGNHSWVANAVDSAYGKYNVWGTAAKFIGHLEDLATPALDSSGAQHNATISGAVVCNQSAHLGKGMSMSAAAGGIDPSGATSILATDIYSVSLWASTAGETKYAFGRGDGTGGKYDAIGVYLGQWIIFNGTTIKNLGAPTGSFDHVVLTRNGTTINGYLNGVNSQIDQTLAISYTTGQVVFGHRPDAALPWSGVLDELRVYDNLVLSAAQIAQIFANEYNPGTFWSAVGAIEQV